MTPKIRRLSRFLSQLCCWHISIRAVYSAAIYRHF